MPHPPFAVESLVSGLNPRDNSVGNTSGLSQCDPVAFERNLKPLFKTFFTDYTTRLFLI